MNEWDFSKVLWCCNAGLALLIVTVVLLIG